MNKRLKCFARDIKQQVKALYLASRDPRTPIAAKCLVVIVVAYALSPIDLIPDFIPVLGLLDDLLIVPLGVIVAVRMIPEGLMAEFRRSALRSGRLPRNPTAAWIVAALWGVAALVAGWWIYAAMF